MRNRTVALALCGLFNVEGYVKPITADELVLNPESVSRTYVKISNPEVLKKYEGRVVKAELHLKTECTFQCEGTIEKVNGTVSPYKKVRTFAREKEALIKGQDCQKKP